MYLNGYVSKLATGGGLVRFLREHLGKPIPSPVLLEKITQGFVRDLPKFAAQGGYSDHPL